MDNLQIISGVIQLKKKEGNARVDFSSGSVFGDANIKDVIHGPQRNFRVTPHVIVSPSDLSLSTNGDTFYEINRTAKPDGLEINWNIDAAKVNNQKGEPNLEIDFLVIGEARV